MDSRRITLETAPNHFHVDKVLQLVTDLNVERAILTNMHIDLDYKQLVIICQKISYQRMMVCDLINSFNTLISIYYILHSIIYIMRIILSSN